MVAVTISVLEKFSKGLGGPASCFLLAALTEREIHHQEC